MAPWTSPQAGPGRSRAWLGSLTGVFLMLCPSSPVDAADIRLIWESTGTSVLGQDAIGTTQTLNVVIEVGEEGLGAYHLEVSVNIEVIEPTGIVTESTPPPLISTMPLINDVVVIHHFDGSPRPPQPPQPPETVPGPVSVVVGNFEVNVIDGGVAASPITLMPLFDGSFIAHDLAVDQLHDAVVDGSKPPDPIHPTLVELEHRFRIIASTEDPRYERLSAASLGRNGAVAFLARPPNEPECNRECEAICITDGDTTTELVRNGGPFFRFENPVINGVGAITFWAADGVLSPSPHMNQGLYLYDEQLRKYFSVDADPAKTPEVGFQALGGYDVNDAGEVVFESQYFDWFEDPLTGERASIPFDTIHWIDPKTPNPTPLELYRGTDRSGHSVPPAPYNGLGPLFMMNNARQVLFYAYTEGSFPDGKKDLMLGGVLNGLPIPPVVVASETSGDYHEILDGHALDNDGNVVFAAKPLGQGLWALYRWHNGTLTNILPINHSAGITFDPSFGLATSSEYVVFGGHAAGFPESLFVWTEQLGVRRIFSAVAETELLGTNGQPIRPSGLNRGPLSFRVQGVDEEGIIAMNISWEDAVDTLVLATPSFTRLSDLRLDQTGFHMTLHGEPGQALTVESTEDFVRWKIITNVIAGEIPIVLNDPQAQGFNARFYRVPESN